MPPVPTAPPANEHTPPVFATPLLPEAKTYDGTVFPLLLSPPHSPSILGVDPAAVSTYLREHRQHILSLLQQHSVLYFRGFAPNASTPDDFAKFITEGLGLTPFPYSLGNAVRKAVVGEIVFTANEAPPEKLIPFHHELAQTPVYPHYLLFYCDIPAQTGGETPLCFSPAVFEGLKGRFPHFTDLLETHGVVYSRVMTRRDRPESAIGRGWASTFKVDSREAAELTLRKRGYQWEWLEGSNPDEELLREISPQLPAVVITNGRPAFFNQIFAAWFGWRDEFNQPEQCVKAGNGEPLDPRAMHALAEILQAEEVAVPWQRGDFMLIDNMQAMHSRKTFTGKRRVLASMSK